MSEIMTIKPRLHFIFQNDSKLDGRNLFADIVPPPRLRTSLHAVTTENSAVTLKYS
jgi:hypothetical protein